MRTLAEAGGPGTRREGQRLVRYGVVLALVTAIVAAPDAGAQQNGEAHATVPTVVREQYDMRAFLAPPALTPAELQGRTLYAQRCANCHGGTAQRPGPPLGRPTVARLGVAAVREKVRLGSDMMPGFEHSLRTAQIDQIIAFLDTYTPAPRVGAPGSPTPDP